MQINISYVEVLLADLRDVHVVGGWAEILVSLVGEDVVSNEMDLSVSVLSGLGGGHIGNLAWVSLEHHKAVLAQ